MSYRQRVADKSAELEAADRLRETLLAREDYSEDPQVRGVIETVAAHAFAEAGGGGHVSLRGVEANRIAQIHLAHALAGRGGFTDGALDRKRPVEPVWVRVPVRDPEVGLLRLRTDGTSWLLDLHGGEFGLGGVRRHERRPGGRFVPGNATLRAARERVAQHGPLTPVDSPWFGPGSPWGTGND